MLTYLVYIKIPYYLTSYYLLILVSDDNSSLQSSPWQREQTWKQSTPRKNLSQELILYYRRENGLQMTNRAYSEAHRKRRNPFHVTSHELDIFEKSGNLLKDRKIFHEKVGNIVSNSGKETTKKVVVVEDQEKTTKEKNLEKILKNTDETDVNVADNIVMSKKMDDGKENKKPFEETNTFTEKLTKVDTTNNDQTEDSGLESKNDTIDEKEGTESTKVTVLMIEQSSEHVMVPSSVVAERLNSNEFEDKSMNGSVKSEESEKSLLEQTTIEEHIKSEDKRKRKMIGRSCEKMNISKYKTRVKLSAVVKNLLDLSAERHLRMNANNCSQTLPANLPNNDASILLTTAAITSTCCAANVTSLNTTSTTATHSCCSKVPDIQKVSPTDSNMPASRLVEYHQQHVSPRKRILRELEKVSLDDSCTTGAKRSRAKGLVIASPAVPTTMETVYPTLLANSSSISTVYNSTNLSESSRLQEEVIVSNSGQQTTASSPLTTTIAMQTSSAPTKLYSSYSIHSLLGGGQESNSNKYLLKTPSVSIASASATSLHSWSNPSLKSPDKGLLSSLVTLGKSKRSPPYMSPTSFEANYQFSTGNGLRSEDGRYSPLHRNKYSNMLPEEPTGSSSSSNGLSHLNTHAASATLPTQHHQNHQHHTGYLHPPPILGRHPQTYYSPYMTPPPYYQPLQTAVSSATTVVANGSGITSAAETAYISNSIQRNTRFSNLITQKNSESKVTNLSNSIIASTIATNTAVVTVTSTASSINSRHIPAQRDFSPPASPRTVPKKTASIRRQFASSPAGTTSTTSTSPTHERRAPLSTIVDDAERSVTSFTAGSIPISHSQQQHHLLQRSSPSSVIAGLHPYSYLYAGAGPPLGTALPSSVVASVNGGGDNVCSNGGVIVPTPPPSTSTTYIPAVIGSPYYHTYISTLAAMRLPQMWMQHYTTGGPPLLPTRPTTAASRFSSPHYHPHHHSSVFPQYGGISNAAALAAAVAAAAAGFSGAPNTASTTGVPFAHIGSGSASGLDMMMPIAASPIHSSSGSSSTHMPNVTIDHGVLTSTAAAVTSLTTEPVKTLKPCYSYKAVSTSLSSSSGTLSTMTLSYANVSTSARVSSMASTNSFPYTTASLYSLNHNNCNSSNSNLSNNNISGNTDEQSSGKF